MPLQTWKFYLPSRKLSIRQRALIVGDCLTVHTASLLCDWFGFFMSCGYMALPGCIKIKLAIYLGSMKSSLKKVILKQMTKRSNLYS